MRRIVVTAVCGVLALTLALASPGLASARHQQVARASRIVKIQIAVGERLTEGSADRLIHRLGVDDLKGFKMEGDGSGFEIERTFTSMRAVLREIRKLHRDGFRPHLEFEKHK